MYISWNPGVQVLCYTVRKIDAVGNAPTIGDKDLRYIIVVMFDIMKSLNIAEQKG